MQLPTQKEMLDAGVHFGHLKKKWNPKMLPNIFMENKGIHIIDLNRTEKSLQRAGAAIKALAKNDRKILFVATKKQARDIVSQAAQSVGMPFVTERWLGGMMTNFKTIKNSIKKMETIDRMLADENVTTITKKERLMMTRQRNKLHKVIGGISDLRRPPAAMFIVDIMNEHLAVDEARKLGVKTFAMVDTNSNPNRVDFPIPSNDDSSRSISLITNFIVEAIREGLAESKSNKQEKKQEAAAK